MTAEILVSVDIEADGPYPIHYSMRSLGAAAFRIEGRRPFLLSTFESNIEPLPGASTHPRTMDWWKDYPKAWAQTIENPRAAEVVMPEFVAWCLSLEGLAVLMGWPAGWDYSWIYTYLIAYGGIGTEKGDLPFHMAAREIRQDAADVLGMNWHDISREDVSDFDDASLKITHRCIDDAIKQGVFGCGLVIKKRTGEYPLPWVDRRTT